MHIKSSQFLFVLCRFTTKVGLGPQAFRVNELSVHSHGRPLSPVQTDVVLFQSADVADCLPPHLSQSRQWELCLCLPH